MNLCTIPISCILCCFVTLTAFGQNNPASPILPEYRDEILALSEHPRILAAFGLIEADASNTNTQQVTLTEIPAPPFAEDERAQVFGAMLSEAGMDTVYIDQVGNVIGIRRGTTGSKTVAFDAHMDTVFPEGTDVSVQMRGDTMFAPGVGDNTRGLALLLSVVRAMNQAAISTDAHVMFIGTVGEEGLGDLRGVKYLFREGGAKIDSWISVDGGTIGRVNNKGLGSHRFKITFSGAGGHSWGAFGLANPHHALGTAIDYFVEMADPITRGPDKTSYNVGRIGGGTSVNSIPFSSWMEIDIRSVNPMMLDTMDVILETAVQKALEEQNALARLGESLTVDIEMIGNRPSGEVSPSDALVQRAMAATAFMGKRPNLTRGSTNSNIPIAMGVPAVTIGRGGKEANAHALDEWWLDAEGYKAAQLALLLLVCESGMAE